MIGETLAERLSCIGELSSADRAALADVKGTVRPVAKGCDILTAGEEPEFAVLVLRGLLCHHRWKRDGTRQIHSFYLAKDAPSLESLHIDYVDSNLGAVVQSTVALIPHAELFRVMEQRPNLRALMWRETLVQAAIVREWLTRNSTLPAHSALAHLFCEMFVRAEAAELTTSGSCDLPATQETLAHALGLTAVHVNRTLQMLRETEMVDLKNGRLYVHEFDQLAALGEFDPSYLHLRRCSKAVRQAAATSPRQTIAGGAGLIQ
jgi:CRP-like cAMP-binding protein